MKILIKYIATTCAGVIISIGIVYGQENDSIVATRYFDLADSLKESAKYDEAFKYFNKSLEIRKQVFGTSHPEVGAVYNGIGRTQISVGDYDLALESMRKALDIFEGTIDSRLGDTYNNIGVVYHYKGDYPQALVHYEQALKNREQVLGKMHKKVAESYGNIGLVYAILGDYQVALEYYQQGLDIQEELLEPGHLGFSYIYNKMGIIYRIMGDYALGQEFYEKALKIRLDNLGPLHPDVADVYINLGVLHERNGDYQLSMEYTNRGIEIYESVHGKRHPYVANFYLNMGELNFKQQQFETALTYYQRGLDVYLEHYGTQHYSVGNVYTNMGNLYASQGQYERAEDLFQKGLSVRVEVLGENHLDVSQSFVNLGELNFIQQKYSQALEYYEDALALRIKVLGLKHPDVARTYNYLATLFLEEKNHQRALEASLEAINANNSEFTLVQDDRNPSPAITLDQSTLLRSLQLKAQSLKQRYEVHGELSDLQLAFNTYQLCDDLIQQLSQGRLLFEDKISLANLNTSVYEETIKVCMELRDATGDDQYLHKAFDYSEKSKSGVLRQMISDLSAKNFGQIPNDLLLLEKQIRLDKDYHNSLIQREKTKRDGHDTTKVNELQQDLFAMNRKYDSLIQTFERNYPKYHQLKFNQSTGDIVSLQEKLEDNSTALIEYYVADSLLYAFVITKNSFTISSIAVGQDYHTLIGDFRESLVVHNSSGEDNNKFFKASYQLYRLLFEAPTNKLGKEVEKVVIIPDGLMSLIPFELLLTEEPADKIVNYAALPYLLKKYQLSFAYSATLWLEKQATNDQWKHQFAGYAPSYQSISLAESNELASYGDLRNQIGNLKYTTDEIRNASSFFDGMTFTGPEATESSFKRHGGEFQILHLAMHAIIDEENPLQSKLIFTQDQDTLEDGFLNAYELYNMRLTAEMAVLSACNTGFGKLVRGEGVLSLGRAFAYAGCPSIVMSLWPAQDKATADIMSHFYQGLSKGLAKDAALREAKLKYLENASDLLTHPFYWGGFVVQGDASPIRLSEGLSWYWLLLGIPLLTVVFVYVGKQRKRV